MVFICLRELDKTTDQTVLLCWVTGGFGGLFVLCMVFFHGSRSRGFATTCATTTKRTKITNRTTRTTFKQNCLVSFFSRCSLSFSFLAIRYAHMLVVVTSCR